MTEAVQLIEDYGGIAVFLGCLVEGETSALLAGVLAHRGVLSPLSAFLAAFAGATVGDTGLFLFGRYMSESAFVRSRQEAPAFQRARSLVRRHPVLFVLGNRFVYGFRTVGGVAAGLSRLPVPFFMALNAVSAVVWAAAFTSIGWAFGIGIEQTLGRLFADRRDGVFAAVALLMALGAIGAYLYHRKHGSGVRRLRHD